MQRHTAPEDRPRGVVVTRAHHRARALDDPARRCHKPGRDPLVAILRDADILDLLGAHGIMRACTSHSSLPEYAPHSVRGNLWQASAHDFDIRFDEGLGTGDTIVDQINFQISCYDNLTTDSAKRLGRPLVTVMREFILQLERESLTTSG